MKSALVRTTFMMDYAWGETDTAETGLGPLEGVRAFLDSEGLGDELAALGERFGMKLCSWGIEIYEKREVE